MTLTVKSSQVFTVARLRSFSAVEVGGVRAIYKR
jgi:hypothetical protein